MGILRIKRSSTQNSIPSTLLSGELALNTADLKLYTIDANNTLRFLNFASDAEKVSSGPIKQALDGKLDNTSVTGSDGKAYIVALVNGSTKYIALLDVLP